MNRYATCLPEFHGMLGMSSSRVQFVPQLSFLQFLVETWGPCFQSQDSRSHWQYAYIPLTIGLTAAQPTSKTKVSILKCEIERNLSSNSTIERGSIWGYNIKTIHAYNDSAQRTVYQFRGRLSTQWRSKISVILTALSTFKTSLWSRAHTYSLFEKGL